MTKVIALFLVLAMAGCDMTSDEVIAAMQKCERSGYEPVPAVRLMTGGIAEVHCYPKVKP